MSPSLFDPVTMPAIQKIYLSGPITGVENWREAFDAADHDLTARGFKVFNPADHQNDDLPATGPEAYKHYMAIELPEVVKSDAVVVLPGWKDSRGARLEVHTAVVCGIPVLSYPDLHILDIEHFLLQKLSYADGTGVLRPVTEERTTLWSRDPRRAEPPFALWPFQRSVVDDLKDTANGQRIVTNAVTGGQKETRPARFDLLPWDQLWKVAELYAYGATKYEDRNWERGYAFSLSIAALMRHMAKFVQGEDDDPESGCPHMASVVFHALALMRFVDATNLDHSLAELDDRPVGKRVRAREDAS